MIREYKEDDRPPRLGWHAGEYTNTCRGCNALFISDKRAWQCADCAYDQPIPKKKYIPETLYSCGYEECAEQISHPADALYWSEQAGCWYCGGCWFEKDLGTKGITLLEYIESKKC